MKKLLMKAVALGAVIAATSAGGFALGSSTSSPVIHACYQTKSPHTLVKDTRCPRGYHGLSWNVTGPQGKQGPPGGANSFVALNSAGGTLSVTDPTPVVALTLPAGKYLLSATTDVSGVPAALLSCFLLNASAGTIDGAEATIAAGNGSSNGTATLALSGAISISSSGTVTLYCAGGLAPASPGSVSHSVVTATELNSLTTTGS